MNVSRKIITSYPPKLSVRGAKQDARLALPAIGRLWPSGDDDGDDEYHDVDDDGGEGDGDNDCPDQDKGGAHHLEPLTPDKVEPTVTFSVV